MLKLAQIRIRLAEIYILYQNIKFICIVICRGDLCFYGQQILHWYQFPQNNFFLYQVVNQSIKIALPLWNPIMPRKFS